MSTTNDIEMYIHCGECLKELPADTSPREYTHNEMGWTETGFQVWCIRHEMNVINLTRQDLQRWIIRNSYEEHAAKHDKGEN